MATYKAVLNNKAKADGTHTILIRVTENRKLKHFSTGESIQKKFWNTSPKQDNAGVFQYVRKSNPSFKAINNRLHKHIEEIKKKVDKLQVKTTDTIEQAVKNQTGDSFFAYADHYIENLKSRNFGTWDQYKASINKLKAFRKNKDLRFEEINHALLEHFRTHLYNIPNSTNTIYKNLKCIRALMYNAIKQGRFPQEKNPFFTFSLEWKKTVKETLSLDEINRLIELELAPGSLSWHVRNYWLFSFYMRGMRISDLLQLKHKNIQKDRLVYTMSKTGNSISAKIHERSFDLLAYYHTEDSEPDAYVFPILKTEGYKNTIEKAEAIKTKTALINKYLKKLAKQAGISKNLSTHIARHTFAAIAKKSYDVYEVQKLLGHSSVKVTENYLQSLPDDGIDTNIESIFNL